MKLTFVHQVLIASAIGLCGIFGLRSIVVGARDGNAVLIALGAVSFAALAGLALYLRKFRAKLRAQDAKESSS